MRRVGDRSRASEVGLGEGTLVEQRNVAVPAPTPVHERGLVHEMSPRAGHMTCQGWPRDLSGLATVMTCQGCPHDLSGLRAWCMISKAVMN